MQEDTLSTLLPMWSRALGNVDVTPADDFFALGGTSLQGVELLAEVTETFGVEVPPLAMYDEASTPAGMAAVIEAAVAAAPTAVGAGHDHAHD